MGRVAAVLDEQQPKAFALLHGGFYRGLREEVAELHRELETATERFNSTNSSALATVLRTKDQEYWYRIAGLFLSIRP